MDVSLGKLFVIDYTPISCPRHTWNLSVRPIAECPYYLSLKNDDAHKYHDYMELWERRTQGVKALFPYEGYFLRLFREIKADGGYVLARAAKPMTIYRGTEWLEDGHRRAAILYALFGPDHKVPVAVSARNLPEDLDLCKNPCA